MKRLIVVIVLVLAGCQAPLVEIHAIKGDQLEPLKAGQVFTAPYDGWYVDNMVMKKILKAKVVD